MTVQITPVRHTRKTPVYLASFNHNIPLRSRTRIAEDPAEYQPEPDDNGSPCHAVQRIKTEALRRTADAHICRLLKLANLVDIPSTEALAQEERALCTRDIREAATQLEECLHALADLMEDRNSR